MNLGKLPIAELFQNGLASQTLRLACLMGLNFFAYQSFSGWLTIYLTDIRHVSGAAIGTLVAWPFAGNILGSFCWGWIGDRFGRRINALGFVVSSMAVGVYLVAPTGGWWLSIDGGIYGFGLAACVVWGPWLTELYPPHLKSTAASIFNWGRLVSFFAPLVTGGPAGQVGLVATMALAILIFILAAGIWLTLPEGRTTRVSNV